MALPLIPIFLIVLTGAGIGVDFYTADVIEKETTQLMNFLNAVDYGLTFSEFVNNCWLFIGLGFGITWGIVALAFPKRKRRNH